MLYKRRRGRHVGGRTSSKDGILAERSYEDVRVIETGESCVDVGRFSAT